MSDQNFPLIMSNNRQAWNVSTGRISQDSFSVSSQIWWTSPKGIPGSSFVDGQPAEGGMCSLPLILIKFRQRMIPISTLSTPWSILQYTPQVSLDLTDASLPLPLRGSFCGPVACYGILTACGVQIREMKRQSGQNMSNDESGHWVIQFRKPVLFNQGAWVKTSETTVWDEFATYQEPLFWISQNTAVVSVAEAPHKRPWQKQLWALVAVSDADSGFGEGWWFRQCVCLPCLNQRLCAEDQKYCTACPG